MKFFDIIEKFTVSIRNTVGNKKGICLLKLNFEGKSPILPHVGSFVKEIITELRRLELNFSHVLLPSDFVSLVTLSRENKRFHTLPFVTIIATFS